MATYKEVTQEVLHLAEELIREHHPILRQCNIGFVFRDEAGTSGGKKVLAKASKVPENLKPHLPDELDILIVIAEDEWSGLTSEMRKATIDHELCHIAPGNSGWTIKAHDIEEFGAIIQRYGLWNGDLFGLQNVLARAVQLELPIKVEVAYTEGSLIALKPEHARVLELAAEELSELKEM